VGPRYGTGMTVLSQWVNQTYNVFNNYTNRASLGVEWKAILQSYGLAVTVSCGLSLGAGILMRRIPSLQRLGPVIPYLAVISAGSCNVGFTRMNELTEGIIVCDKEGNALGTSLKAGQRAVFQTITTRSMFLPVFPLLIPPAIMGVVQPVGPAALALELSLVTVCMGFALPCALALQPQTMEIPVRVLEPSFWDLVSDETGKPIDLVYASKGL